MRPIKCCVGGCTANSDTERMLRFPMNDNLRNLWLFYVVPTNPQLIGLSKDQLLSKHVCQKHFDKHQFATNGRRLCSAYPCLFSAQEIAHGVPLSTEDNPSYNEHEYLSMETNSETLVNTTTEQPKEEGPFSWQEYTEEMVALEKPKEEGPFSWQKYTEEMVALEKPKEEGPFSWQEYTEEMVALEKPKEEGPFSWQKYTEEIVALEQPKEEGPFSWQKYTEEIVALDENFPEDDVKFCGEAQLVPDLSESVSQTQEEYSCNACNGRITGGRYVCVECADWDLCGACEARRHHARHYVLRVPPGKPRSETAWVIAALRQMLASREDPDLPVVKEEVKSEDPLAATDAPCGARAREHQMRDLDTDSMEDVNERIYTERTYDLPSTLQNSSTTYPEASPLMKNIDVVDKKQKISVIAAAVKQKVSQIGTDKIILQKGVVSLRKLTHLVDSPKITGPIKKTSHIEIDTILLSKHIKQRLKRIKTFKQPQRGTVSEKNTSESGETLLDDTISNIVQPTERVVMESSAESWNTAQALENSSGGSLMWKVLENPRQLRVNMTRLRDDDIQNATQPFTSKR